MAGQFWVNQPGLGTAARSHRMAFLARLRTGRIQKTGGYSCADCRGILREDKRVRLTGSPLLRAQTMILTTQSFVSAKGGSQQLVVFGI